MEIVMVYEPCGWKTTMCFLYENVEKFITDFKKCLFEAKEKTENNFSSGTFRFCNKNFDWCDFYDSYNKTWHFPKVYELNKWFNNSLNG